MKNNFTGIEILRINYREQFAYTIWELIDLNKETFIKSDLVLLDFKTIYRNTVRMIIAFRVELIRGQDGDVMKS